MEQNKKVILISLDALASTEFTAISRLPNFSRIIKDGAYCAKENSVYPSLTFPSHASIITGCNPGRHGIVNNYIFNPFAAIPHWNFYAKNLKVKALWDYAAENNKTVLSMSWPVSAGANIKYSMPEMTPAKPKIWNESSFSEQLQVFEEYGNGAFSTENLLSSKSLPQAWFLGKQPELDHGMIAAFLNAIDSHPFDIALLHIYGMDDAKHVYGANSKEAAAYLPLYDDFIGNLMDYSRREAEKGCTVTLMITGDHSQKNVHSAIYGNMVLAEMGYCQYEGQQLTDYTAYLDSCDGMAYVYVKDCAEKKKIVREIAQRFGENQGVARVIGKKEFCSLGCDPDADLVLEAKDGYGFESCYCSDALPPDAHGIAPNHYKALHGYLPNGADYQTMFLCYGNGVKAKKIETMSITDITPTICRWLQMPTEPMDGKAIDGIFREGYK